MPFSQDVYAHRRRAVMERIGAKGAALFAAAPVAVRSHDVEYRYRQDNDLLYLTGFPEPEAVCLLLPGHPKEEFVLFVRPRDPERETWTGRRSGIEGAREHYGADAAYPIDKLDEKVAALVTEREYLHYAFGRDVVFNNRVLGWMHQWRQQRPRSGNGPMAVLDPADIVHEMRLRKSPEEITHLRRAVEISAQAHQAAREAARDGVPEYEIEALLDFTFRRLGGDGPAYPSIVASADNATILHYTTNDRPMRAGDLLLIDAGAEYDGYCADVTRTFPVGGRFAPAQRAVYDIVLESQRAAIDVIRPGVAVDDPHKRAVEVLVDGLLALELLSGKREDLLAQELYRSFYMHRTSHWLGMDVHDVGKYKLEGNARVLEPGMVLTVEPGLYIAANRLDVAPCYRGIGVRIEDDVLVTNDGHEVLSAAIVKDPADIEGTARA